MHIEKAQIIPNTQNTAIQIATIYCHILSSFAAIPGNRMNGIQEVRGSIPLISTKQKGRQNESSGVLFAVETVL